MLGDGGEIEWLRRENASLRLELQAANDMLRRVAALDDGLLDNQCPHCMASQSTQDEMERGIFLEHDPDCPINRARLWMESTDANAAYEAIVSTIASSCRQCGAPFDHDGQLTCACIPF